MHEIHRELNDLAVNSGRAIQSEETGFVHSFYGKSQAPHQAVSVLDNLLFALALCRLKTVEGVQEGKAILEKLLAYQSHEGLFPMYLHEFPFCYDRHHGAALLPALFEIYRHFHRVLGTEITQKLNAALEKLLTVGLTDCHQMSLPNRFRLGGALVGYGKVMQRQEWIDKGHELLNLDLLFNHPSRFIPKHLGEALSGALLADGDAADKLQHWMKSLWHPALCCYAGPSVHTRFVEGLPEITLYDLYMLKEVPLRFKKLQNSLLQAALLFPKNEVEGGTLENAVIREECSYAWVEENLPNRYPFSFLFGNSELPASLILSTVHPVQFDGKNLLQVVMGAIPDTDYKDPGREIFWYFNPTNNMKILVNGLPATTFRIKDVITIEDDTMKIQLIFNSSEGIFQGHFSKAAAPTETQNMGKNRFCAYQWQLLFRTISRPNPCIVNIEFSYVVKD